MGQYLNCFVIKRVAGNNWAVRQLVQFFNNTNPFFYTKKIFTTQSEAAAFVRWNNK